MIGEYYRSPPQGQGMPAMDGVNTWLVTFGDLLTLLLCFFLVTFSVSPLGAPPATQNSEVKPQNEKENLPLASEVPAVLADGTMIASVREEVPRAGDKTPVIQELEITLKDEDFIGVQELLSERTINRLKEEVQTGGYKWSEVAVRAVVPRNVVSGEVNWFVAVSRLLSVKSQFIDTLDLQIGIVLEPTEKTQGDADSEVVKIRFKNAQIDG